MLFVTSAQLSIVNPAGKFPCGRPLESPVVGFEARILMVTPYGPVNPATSHRLSDALFGTITTWVTGQVNVEVSCVHPFEQFHDASMSAEGSNEG